MWRQFDPAERAALETLGFVIKQVDSDVEAAVAARGVVNVSAQEGDAMNFVLALFLRDGDSSVLIQTNVAREEILNATAFARKDR
jgi:hypothetical protein